MSTSNFNTEELTEFFAYLDDLRESGVINMFGAGAYLQDGFNISREDASAVLSKWMSTFSDEPAGERATKATQP